MDLSFRKFAGRTDFLRRDLQSSASSVKKLPEFSLTLFPAPKVQIAEDLLHRYHSPSSPSDWWRLADLAFQRNRQACAARRRDANAVMSTNEKARTRGNDKLLLEPLSRDGPALATIWRAFNQKFFVSQRGS